MKPKTVACYKKPLSKEAERLKKTEIENYCNKNNLKVGVWFEYVENENILNLKEILKENDSLVIYRTQDLGNNFSDVLSNITHIVHNRVTIFIVRNGQAILNDIDIRSFLIGIDLAKNAEQDFRLALITPSGKNIVINTEKKAGRPKGSTSGSSKLLGMENEIIECLNSKISISGISRLLKVHRTTLTSYIEKHKLYDRIK